MNEDQIMISSLSIILTTDSNKRLLTEGSTGHDNPEIYVQFRGDYLKEKDYSEKILIGGGGGGQAEQARM